MPSSSQTCSARLWRIGSAGRSITLVPTGRFVDLDAERRRRELILTVGWTILSGAIALAAYYLIGFTSGSVWTVVGTLAVGGALFGISLTRQFRMILTDDLPELRAIRALGTTAAVFLAVFAGTYLAFPADSFSRPLNHTSALYFAITVLSTVGFGDITPETDPARMVVSLQMLLDFVLIGVIVRVFINAARTQVTAVDDTAPRDGNPDSEST